jgi:predicted Rossmann fold flavoprotein
MVREIWDAIIIGGGAAGLFCAGVAGQRGKRVLLLEGNGEVGAKILISGGGRCNFTNLDARPAAYLSANPHFAKSALARYPAADFIALAMRYGVAWREKTLGQLFCEGVGSARKIVAMLLAECAAGGVEIRTGAPARDLRREEAWIVDTDQGALAANRVVLASGGRSIPKMGASDFAHRMAKKLGVPLTEIAPALVPLTFSTEDLAWIRPLAGVSASVVAQADGPEFREAALFTHRGLSGPAILQASSYWRRGQAVRLDLLPDRDAGAWLLERKRERPRALLRTVLSEALPQRLAEALAARFGEERPLSDLRDQVLREIGSKLARFDLKPIGDEGWAKAEVTRGGIDTAALSSRTMEVNAHPGLFAVGEAVDVTGWLGGYNFQWAWSSGWCAAQAL